MSLKAAGRSMSQPQLPKFVPARTALTLDYYMPHDGGRTTTYEIDISTHDAVGDCKKQRVYLKRDRLPKEFLAQEAIATGSRKSAANLPNASVTICPKINRLIREIQESEGTRPKMHDQELVDEIRHKHKVDHVSGVFTDPRMPLDDVGTTHLTHIDYTHDPAMNVDRTHFQKKTFYREYAEAVIKQKGLGG
eukprot:CAMPEP_0206431794 /NCGR_PEP_ID=MMETSP0324_2-20121206/7559_1 /ASSEMBLY_ACC=CAM_ASM_000836 /TAXON_ID=2866 /ORGANISM="Crypthecodinium cohnii, Strain Seligo" /LENGTH=191 /DNA_ID=CAMNT_0053897755 /DNA_START=191 /DNA_END=763 /DNA_ORIENTATION=+